MMASTTKRRFRDAFKREAVALWETSGRPQIEIVIELGIMPTMLRCWQRKLQEEGSVSRTSPAAKPPVPAMASPADQASEIARLRRELDRARMERDILKNRRHLCGDAAVKFALIEQHARAWPVNVMCRMLGVSRSGYYDWRGRAPSANDGEPGAAR